MAEAKSTAKSARAAGSQSVARRSPAPDSSATPQVATTGELAKIIDQLQKRLASVEKNQTTVTRKRKSDASSDAQAPPTSAEPDATALLKSPASEALETRLQEFRDLEMALHLEEIALHTRAKAAAQEELLLKHETQTLQLKLRSFRTLSQRLREQELQLEQAFAQLKLEQQQLDEERQTMAQIRRELDAARQQIEEDRSAMQERSIALTAPLAALANEERDGSTVEVHVAARFRELRTVSLIALALVAVAGLCVAVAWLTIDPIYRATATIAGLPITDAALTADTADHSSWLTQATIEQSINMLEQRGLRPFPDAATMRQSLQETLILTEAEPGAIEFAYDSPHREQAVLILEALMRSLVQSHTIDNSHPTITRAAAADMNPIRDGRLAGALRGFTLSFCLIAAISIAVYRRRRSPGNIAAPSSAAA